jgi:hypothetical protein
VRWVEEVQQNVPVSELGTAGSERRGYWVRRNAASVVAFRFFVLCMLVQKDRGKCTVFMGAA